jgi:hypothetical protein
MLLIGLLAGFVIIAVDLWVIWDMFLGTKRINHFW